MKTLTVTLKQHTPLIHFQHDQYGATLRASEVKPKLDKFILTKLGENEGYEKGCNIAKNKGWLVGKGEHDALNYFLDKANNNSDILDGNIVIAAAGNERNPYSSYPAACQNVVSVTGL